MIRCLCAKSWTHHEVQVLVSPKGDPFLPQLFDPAHHALVLIKSQFSGRVKKEAQSGFGFVHDALSHSEETTVHLGDRGSLVILWGKLFPLKHVRESLEIAFSQKLMQHAAHDFELVGELYLNYIVSLASEEVDCLVDCSQRRRRALYQV